jgi:hypothetical protein
VRVCVSVETTTEFVYSSKSKKRKIFRAGSEKRFDSLRNIYLGERKKEVLFLCVCVCVYLY